MSEAAVSGTSWDVDQYERYKTYRERPALDLMARIPADLQLREIWDLGCGTGEHAALLSRLHPGARVHGLDSSPAMLAAARERNPAVDWVQGDIDGFDPVGPPDLILTNAALQWVTGHERLFPRLVAGLAPGGVFACQMPMTWPERWHAELRALAAEEPWSGRLQGIREVQPVAAAEDYWRWLSPLATVDVWKTRYLHSLSGEDPVVEWMKGTGLRPYLSRLEDPSEQAAFLAAYAALMRAAFPKQADGSTLFEFPRIFIVARKR
jgi:trans-aconitate 2-methyltransferase